MFVTLETPVTGTGLAAERIQGDLYLASLGIACLQQQPKMSLLVACLSPSNQSKELFGGRERAIPSFSILMGIVFLGFLGFLGQIGRLFFFSLPFRSPLAWLSGHVLSCLTQTDKGIIRWLQPLPCRRQYCRFFRILDSATCRDLSPAGINQVRCIRTGLFSSRRNKVQK